MESKATIEYLNELLTIKRERELSDSTIHYALSKHHLVYAQSLREGRKFSEAFDQVEEALYHVRQSYITSYEKGEFCDLEKSLPNGWDAYELTRYPFFLETDVWAEKANLYVELENWNAAYGCICHAEEMCKVATRKHYHEILNGIPFTSEEKESDVMEHIDEDGNVLIWGDYGAWITYKNVTFHKDKILKHIDTSMINKNTPSDEFLLQYHWGLNHQRMSNQLCSIGNYVRYMLISYYFCNFYFVSSMLWQRLIYLNLTVLRYVISFCILSSVHRRDNSR